MTQAFLGRMDGTRAEAEWQGGAECRGWALRHRREHGRERQLRCGVSSANGMGFLRVAAAAAIAHL